ncbi:hypothetical protein TNCV_1367501 [Trichonephila clavipes]|nr:hypothetical protein TNCV_1367501 [Trichonephila clavipes]
MFDSSSYVNPTPLAHADTSRDVLLRGGTSQLFPQKVHLVEISANVGLKPMFEQGYHTFWLQKQIPILYPALWDIAQKLATLAPSKWVEYGLSAAK